ncbi:type II toxin-antitoxin system RelB/DinJ family antitoxin [Candidatus Saccharibacteria bacterium]|nr:type II toxin-antitoxin system RelB/DinJ family antitoxin [Candidatus Saccharibacteria bacterium]
MSSKTASILTRTEPETKAAADSIFEQLGTSTSGAVNVFLHKVVEVGGFPFEVRISKPDIPDLDSIPKEEFAKMLDEAYEETEKNGGAEAKDFLTKLNKKYGFVVNV